MGASTKVGGLGEDDNFTVSKFFWGQLNCLPVLVSLGQLACGMAGKLLRGPRKDVFLPELSGCWYRESAGGETAGPPARALGYSNSFSAHFCSSFIGSPFRTAEDAKRGQVGTNAWIADALYLNSEL